MITGNSLKVYLGLESAAGTYGETEGAFSHRFESCVI